MLLFTDIILISAEFQFVRILYTANLKLPKSS